MTLPIAEGIERDRLLAKGLKKCAHCRETLPISAFCKRAGAGIGLRSWCRVCAKAGRKAYLLAHLDEAKKQHQQYYQSHKAEKRAYRETYRKAHREEINARNAKHRQTEGGRAKERQRTSRRRALKAGLPNTLSESEWQAALSYFENRCAYCGALGVPLAQEHIIPLTAGGGYVADNIVPACRCCNSSKNNTPLDEWVMNQGLAFVRDGAVERVRIYLSGAKHKVR